MKKWIAIVLCLCMLVGMAPVVSAYYNTADWATDAVKSMYDLGFLPDSLRNADMTRKITRGEMCKIAVAVFRHFTGDNSTPDPEHLNAFDDTNDLDIRYASSLGIVSGYGNGKFGPNDFLTREQFFKITHNLMGTAYCDPQVELQPLDSFKDGSTVSDYAVKPTQLMVAIGVVKGSNGKLNPKNNTSCQEAIVMFFRAYEYMCRWFDAQTEEDKKIAVQQQGYSGISNWALSSVMTMKALNMIPSSLDNSNMSGAITREQMCSIAVLAYTAATKETYYPVRTDHFKDTKSVDVCAAYELGIISGYGNGRFGPNDTLTREQFFKIMANFMKVVGYPRTDSRTIALSKYADGNQVADWAQAPTRLLIYIGSVMGDGKNLNPKNSTSIQEALTVFLRCYSFTINWQKEHPDGEDYVEPTIFDDLVAFAKSYEGYPYVYGGNGPNSFDCSGFVLYCYKHFGYSFSRGAQEQYEDGIKVGKNELLPGDLVFFSGNGYYITHVGLYLGDGLFIHASNPTRGVVIDTLMSGYYSSHYWGACRIITE